MKYRSIRVREATPVIDLVYRNAITDSKGRFFRKYFTDEIYYFEITTSRFVTASALQSCTGSCTGRDEGMNNNDLIEERFSKVGKLRRLNCIAW